MGNFFDCPKCEATSKTESIISISDNCINRLTDDGSKKKPKSEKEDLLQTDDQWIKHLKCLDDIHSLNNELTIAATEKLLEQVEKQIGFVRPQICSPEKIIACLNKHLNCPIKCKKYINEFIDCINKARIEIIQEKIEEAEKCRLLEENEMGIETLNGDLKQEIKL